MEWRRQLKPSPPVSPVRIIASFICLTLKSCALYVLGKWHPKVHGWSLRLSLMRELIFALLCNESNATRYLMNFASKVSKLLLTEKPDFYQGKGFCGYWFGNELTSEADPIILYIHGGGFTGGSTQTYLSGFSDILKCLSKQHGINAKFFSVEYTLAPEAKYPTQMLEVLAAYEFVTSAFPNNPIILMGDSAGGNLTLTLLLSLKSKDYLRQPAAAVPISPWAKLCVTNHAPSYTAFEDVDIISIEHLTHSIDLYLPHDAPDTILDDPMVSPIYGDFSGCCRMLLHYGGKECFKDDCDQLAKVLQNQQVDVTVAIEPLAPHVSPMLGNYFGDMSANGVQTIAAFIATVVQSSG